jgi:hypothetical protein
MTAAEAGVCLVCGKLTNDRYFANSRQPQVGSRRPPLPVALCRTCPSNPQTILAALTADLTEPENSQEGSASQVR